MIKNVFWAWQKQQTLNKVLFCSKFKVPVAYIRAWNSDFHNFSNERCMRLQRLRKIVFGFSHQLQQQEYTLSWSRSYPYSSNTLLFTLYPLSDLPLIKEIMKCVVLIEILSTYFIYNHTWNFICISFSIFGSILCCWSQTSGRWQMRKDMWNKFHVGIKWAVTCSLIPPFLGAINHRGKKTSS